MSLLHARSGPAEATSPAVKAFLIGTAIGVIVVGGFCGGILALFGGGWAGALIVGGFCALWGGPGFGGMMGFVIHNSRAEKAAEEAGHESSTSG